MIMVNMHKAKSTLSQLVEAVLAGEEVVISRRGTPAVKIVPISQESEENLRPIGLGVLAGAAQSSSNHSNYSVADDFADDNDPIDPLNW
ncbi:MAG TPA: type II toxin-antitoxin system prevent-host-death family antitoxin [Candidatus Didemnitutus sp.]|nr:type II toxin-antitoxin system prevent-host-death family antitoxin [Candidatus Didemnitutus sp.]